VTGPGLPTTTAGDLHEVAVTVNGRPASAHVPARRLLSDFLRHDLRLTGTHVGCEHGVCGACTVLLDGEPVRSCLTLAVSVDGHELTTVEGLAAEDGTLHPVQAAFQDCHGLQCGFCTPGFVMSVCGFLAEHPHPDTDEIREGMAGNLCRCTGYANILRAVAQAADELARTGADPRDRHRTRLDGPEILADREAGS
jgi:aerobic carbon-monoxide dehydrogenase small subunit